MDAHAFWMRLKQRNQNAPSIHVCTSLKRCSLSARCLSVWIYSNLSPFLLVFFLSSFSLCSAVHPSRISSRLLSSCRGAAIARTEHTMHKGEREKTTRAIHHSIEWEPISFHFFLSFGGFERETHERKTVIGSWMLSMVSNKNNNFMRLTLNHATASKPIISIYTIRDAIYMHSRTHTHTQFGAAKDEGPLSQLHEYCRRRRHRRSRSCCRKSISFLHFVHCFVYCSVSMHSHTHTKFKKSIDKTLTPVIMRCNVSNS